MSKSSSFCELDNLIQNHHGLSGPGPILEQNGFQHNKQPIDQMHRVIQSTGSVPVSHPINAMQQCVQPEHPLYQKVNHPINQSHQGKHPISLNHQANHQTNLSNQKLYQPTSQMQQVYQQIQRQPAKSIQQPTNQSMYQPVAKSIGRSTNQAINVPTPGDTNTDANRAQVPPSALKPSDIVKLKKVGSINHFLLYGFYLKLVWIKIQ